jgi:hypothetical protein
MSPSSDIRMSPKGDMQMNDRIADGTDGSNIPNFNGISGAGILGWSTIAFAIAFNIPFAILGVTFNYPDILRKPPSVALEMFAAGGHGLIWTWYAFAVAAVALIPLSIALATNQNHANRHALAAQLAAMFGSLAGFAQAYGLLRWVFVVPTLAKAPLDAANVHQFETLNLYGGVAIGEHLGQWLTVGFILALAWMQEKNGLRNTGIIGLFAAVLIAIGTGEGLALALGQSGEMFSLFTIAGFLALTVWLLTTGVGLLRSGSKSSGKGEHR